MHQLNMDVSLHELASVNELSLYADELEAGSNSSSGLVPSSPPMLRLGLLSPEGSPRRFQIVSRKKTQAPTTTTTVTTTARNGQLRIFHSLSSCSMDSGSIDDEYMELIEMESLAPSYNHEIQFPVGLNTLISGQIVTSSASRTPEMQRPLVRRCLSMTDNCVQQMQLQRSQQQQQQQSLQPPTQAPKTPELLRFIQGNDVSTPYSSRHAVQRCETQPNTFKRPEPPSSTNSPIHSKRARSDVQEKENQDDAFKTLHHAKSPSTLVRPVLRKCMSMNDAEIMTALARSENCNEPDLIGDFSKPFVLPLLDGRHPDLKSISSDTVARLLNGDFKDVVANYKIIDCRYPYEFEGGHIRGALNLYTQEQIIEEFLTQQKTDQQQAVIAVAAEEEEEEDKCSTSCGHKRNIIIFHCEFSSERGPKLSRFLRHHDRARNTNSYPALDYPEIYLLHNGYKDFYQTHAELCEPLAYRPMLEPSFSEAYRHFRAKSKSWNGDGCGGATSRHMKKSRSRLML